MGKFIAIVNILLASLASSHAIDKLIGKPTGMVHPRKQRQLEQALNFQQEQQGGLTKGASSSAEGARGLQWGGYHGAPTPPMKYYGGYGPYEPVMKSKKGGGMMGGKKGSGSDMAPDDCRYSKTIVKNPFNDIDEIYCDDDDCEMFVTKEELRLQPFTTNLTAGDSTQDLGTLYVWGVQFPEDENMNPITDAQIQGTCIRTGSSPTASGQCSFTIIDNDGQITMSGSIMSTGGTMAITGGSGTFAGIIGDADFQVISMGAGDPFDDAVQYNIVLTLGLIVCPAQYLG